MGGGGEEEEEEKEGRKKGRKKGGRKKGRKKNAKGGVSCVQNVASRLLTFLASSPQTLFEADLKSDGWPDIGDEGDDGCPYW
jgi:hypothetical protein